MWRDRFSSNNTPSGSPPPPQNRSYSPAPRRTSHLAPRTSIRSNYSPRTPSIQLEGHSNSSTTSLSSSRIPNGSALKQQVTPPTDFIDPLQVLAEIIGKPLSAEQFENGVAQAAEEFRRPSQLVDAVDFNGLSLPEFALEDYGNSNSNNTRGNHNISEQTVEECEYVYSFDRMNTMDSETCFR